MFNTHPHTHMYTHTHTWVCGVGTPKWQSNITHTPHELFKERRNKSAKRRNANAHKIIQLQNIKTKLWLIIERETEREGASHYLYTHLNAKYKQLFKRTATDVEPKIPIKVNSSRRKALRADKAPTMRCSLSLSLSGSCDNFHISKNHKKKGHVALHSARRNSFISMQRADRAIKTPTIS